MEALALLPQDCSLREISRPPLSAALQGKPAGRCGYAWGQFLLAFPCKSSVLLSLRLLLFWLALPLVSGFSPSGFLLWEVGLTVAVSRNTRSVHSECRSGKVTLKGALF